MVCINTHNKKQQRGRGILDNVMKKFTAERYPGERHAYSLQPGPNFGHAMSFMGPGTDLSRRLNQDETPKQDSLPVNNSDYQSYLHDLKYKHIKQDYLKNQTPENKKQQMKRIWQADDEFVDAMNKDTEGEPMAGIAGTLIKIKESSEKLGLPTTFSGMGTDPVARLREIVEAQYKDEEKEQKKKLKKKSQRGGFLPALIPIGVAIASTLGSKAVSDLYDWIKNKISGSGIKHKMNHKTLKDKKIFLKEFINNID